MAAEFMHTYFKRDMRPGGGLLEDHRKGHPPQQLVGYSRPFLALEALCTEVANQLLDEFDAREVWVKATKPEPPIALAVESVSVEVWHSAAGR